MTGDKIEYPYMPEGEEIHYVGEDNGYMLAAKEHARKSSLDSTMPTGSVIVLSGNIIGRGANGSDYHEKHGCERVRRGIPTGEGYELCEGCHPKNHSEPRAIADALKNHKSADLKDAELYLWGHWWACEPCWKAIKKAGIKKVYLMNDSHKLYNKQHPENIVGKQFA
ncbi:MAG TPA: deaminase [Candidatus Saccharimonadales bacterium]|nr:deaminase [Candidatus Saccharimonadales bacterium]